MPIVREKWHTEASLSHILIDEMLIIFGDVSFLLHLPVMGKLLNYSITSKLETLDIVDNNFRGGLRKASRKIDDTRGYTLGFHSWGICMRTTRMQMCMLILMMHVLHTMEHVH